MLENIQKLLENIQKLLENCQKFVLKKMSEYNCQNIVTKSYLSVGAPPTRSLSRTASQARARFCVLGGTEDGGAACAWTSAATWTLAG